VRPVVALFGLGHVGYELARILSRLPVRLLLVDSRPEQLDRVRLADVIDGTADVGIHPTLLGEQVLEQLPAGAHVVIMTTTTRRTTRCATRRCGSRSRWAASG